MHGVLPETLSVAAMLALAIASVRTDRAWWLWRVLPVVVVSFVGVVIVNWLLDFRGQFDEVIPLEFLIWVTMPCVAIGLAVFGWRANPRWQRVVAITAVPLTALYAGNLINQFYGYFPTVGALVGSDVDHQVSADQLGLETVGQVSGGAQQGQNPLTTLPGGAPATNSVATATPTPSSAGQGGASGPTPGAPVESATSLSPAAAGAAVHGAISQVSIPGTQSHFDARTAYVWVPPAFFTTPRPRLPVVVVLAGVPGQPDNMIRAASADKTADRYAAAHHGVAPILIFADANGSFTGDTECVDGPAGNAETYLTKDVPSFVTQAFGTATGPSHWAIEGYSEGGTCALTIALGHPDVYGSFVDIAGDQFPNLGTLGDAKAKAIAGLYGGDAALFDAHDPLQLILKPAAKPVAGWFEVGVKDHRKGDVASTLDAAMKAAGLQSQLVQAPGGHDFPMATRAVADSFAWLAGRLGV